MENTITVEKRSSTLNNDAINLSDILLELLMLYLDPISFLCLREVCRAGRRTVARMAKCTVGDNVWTEVEPTGNYSKHKWIVNDAAFIGKELYVLDIDMELCTFDLPTGRATKVELLHDREMHEASAKKYLVATPDGELMLVLRIWDVPLDQANRKTSGFQVFKLGEHRFQRFWWLKWLKVDDLDGKVLLVSRSCSLCVPWREYPELEENSIYFAENLTGDGGEGVASVEAKVFRMNDQEIESIENGDKFPLFLFLFHPKSVF